ncbi:MAG: hypothetical protein N2053_10850, partial [Chitinispirillaceae bacterium]|nr:hypothetical protein [Chitinispirillaceae bacterium]
LGESNKEHMLIVLKKDIREFNNTITHEIGHALNQVPEPNKQPPGLLPHPHQYTGHGGIGSHCNSVKKGDKHISGTLVNNEYLTGICVMFHAEDKTCIDRFCDICIPYVKATEVTKCG